LAIGAHQNINNRKEVLVRSIVPVSVILLFSTMAAAQIPTSGNVFLGYSYNRTGSFPGTSDSANLNGWEGSLEGKIFPFVGIVADISGHYGSVMPPVSCAGGIAGCTPASVDGKIHSFLFGPRVSVSVGRFTPFAHGLVGVSHISDSFSDSDTSFAYAVGGGIDYKLIPALAWRFQGDRLQTRFFSSTQNDFRFSTGIVLRF
jgi:opacity protein-like surface antigen